MSDGELSDGVGDWKHRFKTEVMCVFTEYIDHETRGRRLCLIFKRRNDGIIRYSTSACLNYCKRLWYYYRFTNRPIVL